MRKIESGFTLIELLIIMGLSLVFLLGTSSLFYLSVLSSTKAGLRAQANALAKEGMEAMIAIRDLGSSQWDWSNTPVNTVGGEYYQPQLSGSSWVLGSKSSSVPILALPSPYQAFTRSVTIKEVQRGVGCGSAVCSIVSSGGIIDTNTRKVNVTVSWQEQGDPHNIVLTSYLTRWR